MNEQEYIEQIIAETGYQPTKEQLDYLNAMSKLSRQEILLELRNSFTSYGSMQPLPELLKSYGANEQFIKTAQKEIAQWYWSNLGKIAEEGNKLTDFEMDFTNKFALDKLKELGLSDVEVNNAFMTDDFFKTGLAFTDPGMRTEFDKFLRENAGMSIFEAEDILNEVPDTIPDNMIIENITDTPTNVVDDVIEIAIPGSLIDISSDPGAKLLEVAEMLNEDYADIDMVELANNLETRIVKKGKGYQQIYTISTKQEKELLDYFIGDLIGFAEEYYNDPLIPSEKARAKRAFEAGYKLQEELKNFNPTDTPTNVLDDFGQKGIKWADGRKALEDVNNWAEDIPILEERFIGNTNDKIILEIIPPEGNVEGLIPSEDYRLQASILRENGDIEIIKTYDNPRQFGADGKNFFNDISSLDTPTNVVDNVAKQVDVQDVRIYFNEAYNKFNEEYMPWNYFENFLINEKELSEDVAKGIIDDIKVGLTKPEFTNFPQSTFDPNLFPKAGTNFDSAVSRNMFNSTQVQRELSSKYILENVEDYLNLSNEQSTKLANTFYEGINPRTTGTIEFYVQQQSPNRILAGDIKSGLDMTHQIPGFYTEPIGNRSLSAIRGVGSNAPINNYYKVQVNTDNLLVDIAPARFAGTQGPLVSEGDNVLGRQINKINWDTFTKETGITYEMLGPRAKIIDGQKYYTGSVQDFSRSLNTFQPNRNITGATSTLSKGNVWEALRKSGIEGFVTGPTNVQYEIVFLDPNDNLGIGKRMNIQDTTVQEFQSNKAAVSQLDELVIEQKPITNLNTYNQEDLNKLGGGNQLIDESKVTQLDETTNAFKTQSNDIVQKLPIEKEVKDKIAKNISRLKVRWSTWSGPLELLDIYETGVMLFYGVVAAAPELKSYANTLMKDMYNTMIEFSGMENYGLKKLSGSDYEPNWSYIGEQVDKAEKILPSEMFIEAIKEGYEKAKEENLMMTGFGYVPTNLDTRKKLETTLTDPKTPEKEDTGPSTYDKIKDTIGEWWKKPIVVYDR